MRGAAESLNYRAPNMLPNGNAPWKSMSTANPSRAGSCALVAL